MHRYQVEQFINTEYNRTTFNFVKIIFISNLLPISTNSVPQTYCTYYIISALAASTLEVTNIVCQTIVFCIPPTRHSQNRFHNIGNHGLHGHHVCEWNRFHVFRWFILQIGNQESRPNQLNAQIIIFYYIILSMAEC